MSEKVVNYGGVDYRKTVRGGYVILHPINDDRVDYSISIPEHRLVYELEHGVKLGSNVQVHHLNRDKSDNRTSNLIAVTREDHMRIHAYEDDHSGRTHRKRHTDDILANIVSYEDQIYYRRLRDGKYVLSPVIDGHINFDDTVYEHRLVYELAHGIKLDSKARITHVNGDNADNRIENLAIDSKHFSRPSKQELERLIEHHTDREISEMFGVKRSTVYKWRSWYGIAPENGYKTSGRDASESNGANE